MHIRIVVSDDAGHVYEGETDLRPTVARDSGRRRSRSSPKATRHTRIDFGLPQRAFLKKYAQGSGPQRFAVLLAQMTQGRTGVEVTLDDLVAAWTRNRGVLGGTYRTMYATRSKEKGWSDSRKRGAVVLRADWRGALEQ